MPGINPHRGFGTEDIGDMTAPLYFSDTMTAAIFAENTFLPHVKKGEEIDQVTMHWVEDLINPFQITSSGAYLSTDTQITLSAGQGKLVRVGTNLKSTTLSSLVEELMRVTNVSGDVVTVDRGYGSTTAVAGANPETLTIIGNPLEE